MAWLLVDSNPVASTEDFNGVLKKSVGLLGKDKYDGAAIFKRVKSVHTFGMKFPIDVAFVDKSGQVIKVYQLKPYRVVMPVLKAQIVIEAQAGAFFRWSLKQGCKIELKD